MSGWTPNVDEKWVHIQQNTFTNWVNQQLKERDMSISDLATDFHDGVKFINLVEEISGGKSVGKYNLKPKIISQKLENTSLGMAFLVREGVKLVNIGNEDLVNGNLKLILGLIWTLILRYQIQKGSKEGSAKNELLEWVRSKIPEYNIQNFNKDWRDGRAICALVNAIGPGLCPNHWDLGSDALGNAKKGIDLAEKRLDIPAILNPEDMISPDVDDLSMMTYISYFRNASMNAEPEPTAEGEGLYRGKVQTPAHFKIMRNGADGILTARVEGPDGVVPSEFIDNYDGTYSVTYHPSFAGVHDIFIELEGKGIPTSPFHPKIEPDIGLVRAYGPGLETGKVGEPGLFVVEPNGHNGVLEVTVQGPKDPAICTIKKRDDGNYDCEYTPTMAGEYIINVKMDGEHVPGSPFHVIILPDVSKIRAYGPGLERGVVGEPGEFKVEPNGNDGVLKVWIEGPNDPAECFITKNPNGTYDCKYTPTTPGEYIINVTMNDEHVPGSPFHVIIEPDVTQIRAYGPGLERGTVNVPGEFKVDPNGNDGNLKIWVQGPNDPAKVTVVQDENTKIYDVIYEPTEPGEYIINVTMNDKHVPGSPFHVLIKDDYRNVVCSGPGLEGGTADTPTDFTVFMNGHKGELKVWIEGPNDPALATIFDNQDGTYKVEYTPTEPGEYHVNVTADDIHVPGSPFIVIVQEKRVRTGPSLGGEGKIRVFYTTTSSSAAVKQNQKKLQTILEKRNVHRRPDFEPWIALDVGMNRDFREMIFAKAGRREPPLMFIDDEIAPTCDEIYKMEAEGKFDELLRYMPKYD